LYHEEFNEKYSEVCRKSSMRHEYRKNHFEYKEEGKVVHV